MYMYVCVGLFGIQIPWEQNFVFSVIVLSSVKSLVPRIALEHKKY